VGSAEGRSGFILRWNGRAWKRVPSPGGLLALSGVAAVSARSAWAVGETAHGKIAIEGWNGTVWKLS
jgi:hypothetical protein